MDLENLQTLMNPINLFFFFEKYKEGNLDAIRKKFSLRNQEELTNEAIKGIYDYLGYVVDRQVLNGTYNNDPDYQTYAAFGSLMAGSLSKSYGDTYE
mmetsp:Transcript_15641/g.23980  ORF Transcript_15641/g.23980 Transcript_15641/m.23980 type:complete len:97 (+) Transcript_15641:1196-1486(+)